MVDQMNRWIHSGQGFGRSFDLPRSEWSRITDPYPHHPKGTHPTRRFMWQTTYILLGIECQYVPTCNDRNLIGKSGEYLTKMFLFSVFNLIKKDKGVSEEKIRYTGSWTCNIKVTKCSPDFYRHSVRSVGRACDCKTKSCRLDSWDWTNTQGLKITEKWRYLLCTASR